LNIGFFPPTARYGRAFIDHCAGLREALKPNFLTESRNLSAAGIHNRASDESPNAAPSASDLRAKSHLEEIGRPACDPVEK
jgi:hypothetical protein